MSEPSVPHKPGYIPPGARAHLGKCPKCKQSFSDRKFALQCCMCQQNFHSHCMNNSQVCTNDMTTIIRTMNGNLICTNCEPLAQTTSAEAAALTEQVDKFKKQMRAQEAEAEKNRRSYKQKIVELTAQSQSQGTSSNDTVMREFNELKATHQATQKKLTDKYNELLQQNEALKSSVQQTIAEKTHLAEMAAAEANKLKHDVEQLVATNAQLQQQRVGGDLMETDEAHEQGNAKNNQHMYARFEALMLNQQQKLADMIVQAIAPVRQNINEVVDRRLATLGHSTTTSAATTTTIVAHNEQQQQQALLKPTDSTFAEALYTNSPKGKFSIVVEDTQKIIIDRIELDEELTDCGRCHIIERRTPTSLAVFTDEATSICLREKLQAKYPDAEIRGPAEIPLKSDWMQSGSGN